MLVGPKRSIFSGLSMRCCTMVKVERMEELLEPVCPSESIGFLFVGETTKDSYDGQVEENATYYSEQMPYALGQRAT